LDLRPRPLPGVLVANKMDLGERVQVLRQDGMQMAQELGLQYAETSAKEAQDVEEPFKLIAAAVKRAFDQSGEGLPGEAY